MRLDQLAELVADAIWDEVQSELLLEGGTHADGDADSHRTTDPEDH
jgi:hypothetical protein